MDKPQRMFFLKSLIKNIISIFIFYSGIFHLFKFLIKKTKHNSIIILKYHITPLHFEKEIKYLSKNHTILRLEDLMEAIIKKRNLPYRSVVITFDDGYRNFYTNAYPILKKYQIPAALFLPAGLINTEKMLWWDEVNYLILNHCSETIHYSPDLCPLSLQQKLGKIKLDCLNNRRKAAEILIEELKGIPNKKKELILKDLKVKNRLDKQKNILNKNYLLMTWDQVREVSKNGISIGSHSLTHPILINLEPDEIIKEIKDSKNIIEKEIGKTVNLFCYPNGKRGFFNSFTKEILKKSGFLCACSSIEGTNNLDTDLFELRRIDTALTRGFLGRFSRSTFALEMFGFYDFIRRIIYR